jgi:hypothetical protein
MTKERRDRTEHERRSKGTRHVTSENLLRIVCTMDAAVSSGTQKLGLGLRLGSKV